MFPNVRFLQQTHGVVILKKDKGFRPTVLALVRRKVPNSQYPSKIR